jgi:3-hydroxyacyl-[acyl-carrier-protein] dehydratase
MRWILIDRLLECEPGRRAVGSKSLACSDPIFADHFPDRPLVPGVLLIEMVAQTMGKCIKIAHPEILTLLGKVISARFIHPVRPGDECLITVEVEKLRPAFALGWGSVQVGGIRVAETNLMVALVPRDNPNVSDPVIEDWKQRQGGSGEPHLMETRLAPAGD